MDVAEPVSTADRLTARESRVLWLLLGAAFVATLNETSMTLAIPRLIRDLSIPHVMAHWLTTAFLITTAIVIPTTGFLLRRFTTRTVFLVAMTFFCAGTLAAALAPDFAFLVVARIVQACGTAVMMPLLTTTLMTVVPAQHRGQAMGRVSIVMSVAPVIGPTLAGFTLDTLNWRWIFGIVLPIALVLLGIGARWMLNLGEIRSASIDGPSVVLSAFGFGGIVFALSQIGDILDGSTSEANGSSQAAAVTLVIGVVALVLFTWRQVRLQRFGKALLDLRVFRSRGFTLSILHRFVLSIAFFGVIAVLPLFLQHVVGLNAAASGLTSLPGALAWGLLGPAIGRVYDRWGTRVLLIPGAVIATATLWWFTTIAATTPVWLIVIAQTVLSIGLALSYTPLFATSLGSIRPELYSYGSAALGTFQQVGGAAGIAVMYAVLAAVTSAESAGGASDVAAGAAGARASFVVAAVVVLPTLVSAFLIRKPPDALAAGHVR